MNNISPISGFAIIKNVRFHYLDWGGNGIVLLLLAGGGNTAWIYSSLAPMFTDNFRVMGLTRRGHGKSDVPAAGYDIGTRVEDIRLFLELKGVDRVILVGHSIAGDELSHFARLYPERIHKLVYLDAAYDRSSWAEVLERDPLLRHLQSRLTPEKAKVSFKKYVDYVKCIYPMMRERWDVWEREILESVDIDIHGRVWEHNKENDKVVQKLRESSMSFRPDYSRVRCPSLSIFAIQDKLPNLPSDAREDLRSAIHNYWLECIIPIVRESIARFHNEVVLGQIIEWQDTDHYFFLSRENDVVRVMREFLLN